MAGPDPGLAVLGAPGEEAPDRAAPSGPVRWRAWLTAVIAWRAKALPDVWAAFDVRASFAGLATWRALGRFWIALLVCLAVLGLTLQLLGPPVVLAPRPPARVTPGPISPPNAALLEPLPSDPGHFLPRIAADGRTPMAVYAAGFPGTTGPRVGLIVAGIGLDHAASAAVVHELPGDVTLAISPYARDLDGLLTAARTAGDETLVSIPMEPSSGVDDPGDHALMTALPAEENARRLNWALSRIAGYVGATGALGRLHGERFAAQPDLMDPVLRAIARRGLLYIDPRPDAPRLPGVPGRTVDVVVDADEQAGAIDAKLADLARIAREHGSAIGLVGAVWPVTMARITAWTQQLAAQGLTLAPVSILAEQPASR